MKIHSISSNQPAYKGYIDKSFKDYIYYATKNECLSLLNNANKKCQKVDAQRILYLKLSADGIINKFSKYMENLEEHTGLKVLKGGSLNKLAINNPIYGGSIEFCNPFIYQEKKALLSEKYLRAQSMSQFMPSQEEAGAETLAMLDKVADELETIPAEDIDKKFLEFAEQDLKTYTKKNGTNFWKRMKARKTAQKIDSYAQTIGVEPVNQVRVEEYIRNSIEAKEALDIKKLREKEIKNNNAKIINDILKN